jgi:hypothetical protein
MAVEGFRQCGWNIQIELPPARLTLDALKFDWIAHAKTISLGIYIVNKNIEKINRWTASEARTRAGILPKPVQLNSPISSPRLSNNGIVALFDRVEVRSYIFSAISGSRS